MSEDPKIPESQIFDATNWDFVQVPRQSGAAEGFGDVGTVFYATVQLPANFGTPGDSPDLVSAPSRYTPALAQGHR